MSAKSKEKSVSMKVKLEAVKRLRKGETIKILAGEYGVGKWEQVAKQIKLRSILLTSAQENGLVYRAEYKENSEALST